MLTFDEFQKKIRDCQSTDDLRALEKDPSMGLAAFSSEEMALLRGEWHRKAVELHNRTLPEEQGGTNGPA